MIEVFIQLPVEAGFLVGQHLVVGDFITIITVTFVIVIVIRRRE